MPVVKLLATLLPASGALGGVSCGSKPNNAHSSSLVGARAAEMRSAKSSGLTPLCGLSGLGVCPTTGSPKVPSEGTCRDSSGGVPRTEEPEVDPEAGSSADESTCTDCESAMGSDPDEELLGAWTDDACEG